MDKRGRILYAFTLSPYGTHNSRQLTILELEHATRNFNENNVIGQGRFGFVYKGLLQDGSIVAIKRRLHAPTQYFFHEVKHIARVNHAHILRLIGYVKILVNSYLSSYDYLPNGNVGIIYMLGLRKRLSVALGAAKSLAHLHSLVPPLLYMHFRTSNVLVDDIFTAKVSDYGLTCDQVSSSLPLEPYIVHVESLSFGGILKDLMPFQDQSGEQLAEVEQA
ncbi:hypothetical protein M0R45_016638 [Rubus argutus]|uniref:non-specific serine/threonine protein kinase n=1 Tax=Rubus argutus TaxID=59490 RepID=A0AAW1XVM5_RUBAR